MKRFICCGFFWRVSYSPTKRIRELEFVCDCVLLEAVLAAGVSVDSLVFVATNIHLSHGLAEHSRGPGVVVIQPLDPPTAEWSREHAAPSCYRISQRSSTTDDHVDGHLCLGNLRWHILPPTGSLSAHHPATLAPSPCAKRRTRTFSVSAGSHHPMRKQMTRLQSCPPLRLRLRR